jgi:pyruvate,water dikinase
VYTIDFKYLTMKDLEQVGGKNASLGEMISHLSASGVVVPKGFATTADAFRDFLSDNQLDKKIQSLLSDLNVDHVVDLARAGQTIREWIIQAPFSGGFEDDIRTAYFNLAQAIGHDNFTVAVRSSATAEDLPDASFAGQQETFLNVKGIDSILIAIKEVFASLYNDRAIAYRTHHGFQHHDVALSAGIQQMIRSDQAASGVMFTMDTESGFDQVVFITSSYGLGEMVVQGAVNPDEFYVHKSALSAGRESVIRRNLGTKLLKMIYNEDQESTQRVKTVEVEPEMQRRFSLTPSEIEQLAKHAMTIEAHYGCAMDIEWAKDPAAYHWQEKTLEDFRTWLIKNNFDPDDKKLTIGHPQVGQVDLIRTFKTDNYKHMWTELEKRLNVYSIKTSQASAIYDYQWDDANYIELQIKELK